MFPLNKALKGFIDHMNKKLFVEVAEILLLVASIYRHTLNQYTYHMIIYYFENVTVSVQHFITQLWEFMVH
ncbi:unnamed protein product [Rhizophagus irregularis]|nr:unnamed protein product [Rhizophagus irregularis]